MNAQLAIDIVVMGSEWTPPSTGKVAPLLSRQSSKSGFPSRLCELAGLARSGARTVCNAKA